MSTENNEIDLATFSEDFSSSNVWFKEVDGRESLYADNSYRPCSAKSPILLQDHTVVVEQVPDMVDKGDKIVSKKVAEIIMAFDPYGVEIYPALLEVQNGICEDRYILSVKNIIDVMDIESTQFGRGTKPGDNVVLIYNLYISADRLQKIPLHKRLVFRVKDADDTIFFDASITDYAIDYFTQHGASGIRITPFDTSEEAPIM